MAKKKQNKLFALNKAYFYLAAIIVILIVELVCSYSGLYDMMTGREGLGNVIAVITLRTLSALLLAVPLFFAGVDILKGIYRNREEMPRPVPVMIGMGFLTFMVPMLLFFAFNRTLFDRQQTFTGKSEMALLAACVSDYFSDEYTEITADDFFFYSGKHITSTGRGGASYHYEYAVRAYSSGYIDGLKPVLEAQIGKRDRTALKDLPVGFDTRITVYKNSGFIRSIESTVDFNRAHSYENMFVISEENGVITRSEPQGSIEVENIQWCGFKKGQSGNVKNALCGINAANSLEYPYTMNYDEFCLYGWADGGYKRVSNIIYGKEPSQNQ